MTNLSELARLAATLFYSGVFWMMVMFLVENGTSRTSSVPSWCRGRFS